MKPHNSNLALRLDCGRQCLPKVHTSLIECLHVVLFVNRFNSYVDRLGFLSYLAQFNSAAEVIPHNKYRSS